MPAVRRCSHSENSLGSRDGSIYASLAPESTPTTWFEEDRGGGEMATEAFESIRPRVRGWTSPASRSNERWAMDVTPIPCGQDG